MRVLASVVATLATTLIATAADASPSARLVYARGAGAEACGDESDLRKAVAARLGYDPFFPWAKQTVTATLSREAGALHGDAKLVDEHGVLRGRRELSSSVTGCRELLDALALAISIALDPLTATAAPAPAEDAPAAADPNAVPPLPVPQPPSAPEPRAPVDVPVPAAEPTKPAMTFTGGLGVVGAVGAAPAMSFGVTLFGALRWPSASLALEGRADLPASAALAGGGQINSSLLVGSVVPCLHRGAVFGCAMVSVGAFIGRSEDLAVSRSATAVYAAGGGRVGVEVALTDAVYARLHGDLLATFTRNALAVDGITAYTAPPLSFCLGAGLLVRFE